MRVVCASAVLLVGSLAGAANAQPVDPPRSPAELVAEGERLARDGQVPESLPLFREAARLAPSGEHECLVALTYFRLARHPEAWLHLQRAIELGQRPQWCGDAVLVRDVERELDKGGFAVVVITVEPEGAQLGIASLAPEERLAAPARLWLPWGTQRIRVEAEGYRPREVEVVVDGKEPIPVAVVLDPVQVDGGVGLPSAAGTEARGDEKGATRIGRRKWPWALVVTGTASLLGGAGFHLAAARSRDAASELYAGPAYEAEIDRFRVRRGAAIGFYAAGAALTAAGVVLLLRGGGERTGERFGLWLTPTQGGAAAWLQFER